MLREFLDEILDFIGSETLSDMEFDDLGGDDSTLPETYTLDVYTALKGVVEDREGVSGQGRKLKAYFQARGLDIDPGLVPTPNSNILIGKALC